MFYLLLAAAAVLFISHVALLLLSFPQSQLAQRRYFYSHLTLWLTGIIVFVMAWFYSNTGHSDMLAYFDTSVKKAMILVFTFSLSLVAHCIVMYAVLPLMQKNKR
ncbi:MAG: hypothetical protein V4619_01425 [Bacteroidota bacterium]